MENLLFLGVPILKHIRVFITSNEIETLFRSSMLSYINFVYDIKVLVSNHKLAIETDSYKYILDATLVNHAR